MDFLEDGHFGAYSNRANCSTSIDGLPDGTSLGSFWSRSPSFLRSKPSTSHLFNRSMSNRWNVSRFSSARFSTQFFFWVHTYRYRCNPRKDGIGIYCWFFLGVTIFVQHTLSSEMLQIINMFPQIQKCGHKELNPKDRPANPEKVQGVNQKNCFACASPHPFSR